MNLELSKRLITRARESLSAEMQGQFSGIINYTRVDLTTFNALDMITMSEAYVDYDLLQTYLPALYSGIFSKELILSLLYEDKADFICNFKAGMIFQKPINSSIYFDYVSYYKENGVKEANQDLKTKVSSSLSNDLRNLYGENNNTLLNYLSSCKILEPTTMDIYDRHDVITSEGVTRSKMDKSKDIYS